MDSRTPKACSSQGRRATASRSSATVAVGHGPSLDGCAHTCGERGGQGAVVSTCMRAKAHQVWEGAPTPNEGQSGGARYRYAPSWANHRYAPSWANHRYAPSWASHRYAPSWASQPDPLRSGSARPAPCRALACLPSPRQCPAERDGNQRQSEAIRGNQWQSAAITCGARREKGTTVRVSVGCSITCGER